MLKKFATELFHDWGVTETREFISQIEPAENLLDLGCGDGVLTKKFGKKAKSKKIVGIDGLKLTKNFKVVIGNLNHKLPVKSGEFDAVVSHFALEHLYNTGVFISETKRVLKKGGYTLIATDNMSSWANVISLILGFQPFSTTNGIAARAIGNPFAIRSSLEGTYDTKVNKEWRKDGELSHNKVLAYRGLIEAYEEYGFEIESITGIGYLPFKGKISQFMCALDTRHAHLFILKARKK